MTVAAFAYGAVIPADFVAANAPAVAFSATGFTQLVLAEGMARLSSLAIFLAPPSCRCAGYSAKPPPLPHVGGMWSWWFIQTRPGRTLEKLKSQTETRQIEKYNQSANS